MRITERRLRSIIKSVIEEISLSTTNRDNYSEDLDNIQNWVSDREELMRGTHQKDLDKFSKEEIEHMEFYDKLVVTINNNSKRSLRPIKFEEYRAGLEFIHGQDCVSLGEDGLSIKLSESCPLNDEDKLELEGKIKVRADKHFKEVYMEGNRYLGLFAVENILNLLVREYDKVL